MSRDLLALLADITGLVVVAAAVFLLVGLAWALLTLGAAVLVLNWRYGPA